MAEEASEKKADAGKMSQKRIWTIVGIAADVTVTVFLLVLSIIMLANISNKNQLAGATGFMGMIYYLMANPTVFLLAVVVPLFILLVVNVIITVVYYQKVSAGDKKQSLDKLTDEQKKALREELLKEMSAKKDDASSAEDKKSE